jgi:hypothetical protein
VNLTDIQTRVFRTFGDEASIQITSDDIIRWVNDAQREIAISANLLETKATQVTSSNPLSMPSELMTLHSVSIGNYPVTPISFAQGQELLTSPLLNVNNDPTKNVYWIFGRSIYFWPSLPTNSSVTLYYTREPTAVSTSNTVIDLPINYHSRILEYVLKQAYELDENYEAMAVKGAEFDKNMSEQANQEAWSSHKTYPFITVLPEDY